jgi:hypothetical protein
MMKSSRHSKITGDFAEALVLYRLSRSGYECARVDHTGIDLIACSKDGSERIGISVKSRSRYDGTEKDSVNLPSDSFEKALKACESFQCDPFYAIVVDSAKFIRCFLLPLKHVKQIATGTDGGMRYWQMGDKFVKGYCADPEIRWFELETTRCSWDDARDRSGHTT